MTSIDEHHDTAQTRARDYRALVEYGLDAGIGVGHSLGLHLEVLEAGRSVWTLTPAPRTAGVLYAVHHGVLAALMETAMDSAVYASLAPRTTSRTAEMSTKFVREVRIDDPELVCEASVVHLGGHTATAEAHVLGAGGDLVAHGTGLCLLFPVPAG